ncbi:MAG: chloride channel protein [Gemmatimonadetes bacterium]|nr:chloride channel protein [Gemmatimonadota bacterium]
MLLIAALAAIVGAIGAGVAWVLVRLIDAITALAWFHHLSAAGTPPSRNTLGLAGVLVPVAGALVIGLIARFGSEKIRGHGIPEAMEAILIGRSRLSAKVAVLKPLSSALAIGTGGPFGAEGPIIMTGAAFGSVFAQAFHLSDSERKTLLVAGAAAGMAAIFAAPMASVLLAVELLLFEWKPRSFVPVAVAATVGAVLRVPLLGAGVVFPVVPHAALAAGGLAAGLAVGVVAGFASAALTKLCYFCEDSFATLPIHWMWWPAIGGVVVGVGGLFAPRALGVGYDVIRDLFAGNLVAGAAAGLLLAKAVMWAVALGSGTSGGVLAPLLIMGGAIGAIESSVIPGHDAGLWAMISMAAMMGGTMRSPLTAVVFLLELTGDIKLLPGLLIACVAAHAVTVLVMRRSILTEKVARRGHHVLREYVVNPLAQFRVEDVMHAVGEAAAPDEPAIPQPAVTYPDELLDEAMTRMILTGAKELPVVARADATVVGIIDAEAIARIWRELHDEEHVRAKGAAA